MPANLLKNSSKSWLLFYFLLLGKQGKPVRVFGFALACWEFPNPFSHFVWLRVSAKRWITSDGILQKKQKEPEPDTDKIGIWLRSSFHRFPNLLASALSKYGMVSIFSKLFFPVFPPVATHCFMRLLVLFHTDSYTDNGAICYFRFVSLSAIIAAT